MSCSAVFPERVREFAENVTHAVEDWQDKDWSEEDIRQISELCQKALEKVTATEDSLQEELKSGVDSAAFIKRTNPLLDRINKLLDGEWVSLSEPDRFQAKTVAGHKLLADFNDLGRAIARVRDLLKEAFLKMSAPRQPIDWQRVQEAKAAFTNGATRPFKGPSEVNGN